ncbi:MAG: hypothetical protein ABR532_09000 [Candidatus Dormibacteria bacterium]
MSTPSNLSETAEAILAASVVALGARVPARQYIAAGLVAYDQCEQLTCSWSAAGLYTVDPFPARSSRPVRCAAVIAADFLVECTRCVPVIEGDTFPDPAAITSASEEIMADGATLFCALLAAAQAGTLFGGCRLFVFGAVTPYGPFGTVGAVRIPLTVQMTCTPPGS